MIAVINNDFKLDVVSVRLVKDAPILSDIKITTPEDVAFAEAILRERGGE